RIAIACLMAFSAPTFGQGAAAPGADQKDSAQNGSEQLERVVVTAERRETVLDTTPAAITALRGRELAEEGFTGLADVVGLVPNVSFTTGGDQSQIFIRGIGNVFILAGGDPGVATYADGAYISDQTSTNVALFDLARVEVLRGPQGALYGRNATGGAVNLISAKPTDSPKASAGVLGGNYGRKESEGFVSGPVFGDTKARLSYQVKKLDGYTANPLAGSVSGPVVTGETTTAPEKLDDLDARALRLQTSSDFGESNLRLIAGHLHEDNAGPSVPVLVDPVMISQLLFGVVPSTDPRVMKSQGASQKREVNHVLAAWDMPIGANTLNVTASWRGSRLDHFFDSDATEALVASTRFKTRSADKSIDIHLASETGAPFQWLVGATALAFDQRQDIDVSTQVPLGFLVPGAPLTTPLPGGLQFLLGGNVHARSFAVYTDLRYALTQNFALLGGLRYNRDKKRADEYLNVAALGMTGAQELEDSWSSVPGSIGVEYKLGPQTLTYARFSTGFKSGAVNLGALQSSMVKPERAASFEVGFKTDFWQRRGLFSTALFTTRYKDMQVSQVGLATVNLANASSARIDGAEFELALLPIRGLQITAAVGLMDPEYTDFENVDLRNNPTQRVNVRGNQLAQVSREQASLAIDYALPISGWRPTFSASYVWRGTYYFTEFNTEDAKQEAYGLLNLALSIAPTVGRTAGGWKVYGYVKNATDETAITSMSVSSPILGAARQVSYTPPRQYGVGISVDF
ncbi:MAG TPA: TonB-dependent receptor, partial [Burkholderiaceae bacterium]|nr:TonB-dependent receptor [Burkholderiaceae bacterium]